ncbi:hypothetical protein Ccrd_008894 [Cynara cardunculus var. scolymus]|uniref:Acyclic terpene utilisation N-terminal domain-containing protein n=1 Tax=Cynara cardunculus var. scolymus TaxID=59895 RepID=A0A118JT43_CYNCS|nr:hypothetical protein Ccrd_008894 [Cynara cardunculus var. scolymus]
MKLLEEYIDIGEPETHNCVIKLRVSPKKRREKVLVGCGAGFGGDRPLAALKLLQKVKDLNYLVLECLAERTLTDRYQAVKSGGDGYDPRKECCISIDLFLFLVYDYAVSEWMQLLLPLAVERGVCIITNMGARAAPIVECLEKYNPNVVITSRVADAALFLAPMVYELGWNWDSFLLLAQGSLAGHLLE